VAGQARKDVVKETYELSHCAIQPAGSFGSVGSVGPESGETGGCGGVGAAMLLSRRLLQKRRGNEHRPLRVGDDGVQVRSCGGEKDRGLAGRAYMDSVPGSGH
jgi:hypothetical protein